MEQVGGAVQGEAGLAVHLFASDFAQGKVGGDGILSAFQGEGVQVRVLGRPQVRLLGGDGQGIALKGIRLVPRLGVEGERFGTDAARDGNGGTHAGGGYFDILYIILRHHLVPDGLPDAADGGVPHTAAAVGLLAVGEVGIQGVPYRQGEEVFSRDKIVGDIKGKGQVAARMSANLAPTDGERGNLVHSTKVKQQTLAREVLLREEGAAVNIRFPAPQGAADARQAALGGKRHPDFPKWGEGALFVLEREVPFSREGGKALALHLGTGIVGFPRGGEVLLKGGGEVGETRLSYFAGNK